MALGAPEQCLAGAAATRERQKGKQPSPEANTEFSGSWGEECLCVCVRVWFFPPETPQLILLVSLSLPSGQTRLCNSLLFPAWPDVFSC